MPVIGALVKLYRTEGIDICTGLSSHDFSDLPTAPFTRFIKNGRSTTEALGIALQEIYFLENLFSNYKPGNIFILGNSQGWSTLAIGLLMPDSRVVAMDAGFDTNSLDGLDLTNRMAATAGLKNLTAARGVSPQDVSAVIDAELRGSVDFVFIDGLHTNEQVVLDFEAVSRKAGAATIYLFHDVQLFNLYPGLRKIERLAGCQAQSLRATPSGMAIVYDPARHPELAEAIAPFAPTSEALNLVQAEAGHYRLARYLNYRFVRYLKPQLKRSMVFMKGVNAVCRLVGAKPYLLPG